MLAVSMAAFSLTQPWYQAYDRYEFSLSHYDSASEGLRSYGLSRFSEVGGLMDLTAAFITIWAVVALVYVAGIIPCERNQPIERKDGFFMGWLIMVLGLLPAICFAIFITGAFNMDYVSGAYPSISFFIGSNEIGSWGPMMGWYIVMFAGVVQATAVLARNLPILTSKTADTEESLHEQEAHGDLPIR